MTIPVRVDCVADDAVRDAEEVGDLGDAVGW